MLVSQTGRQPSLDLLDLHPLAVGVVQHLIFSDPLRSSSEPFRNRCDPTSPPKRWPDRSFRIRRYGPSVRCSDEVAPHRLDHLPFRRRDDRFDDEPTVFDRPTDSRGSRPGSAMSMMVAPPGLRSGFHWLAPASADSSSRRRQSPSTVRILWGDSRLVNRWTRNPQRYP